MHIELVTLFPEMVRDCLRYGVVGRALEAGLASVRTWNPRDYARDRHRTVDDRPFGGGPGMVLKFEPLRDALRAAKAAAPAGSRCLCLSAAGRLLDQPLAAELAHAPGLVLLAGRYEGVDERLIESEIDAELSIGDYVLSGGELASLVVIDAVLRLLPGVLGHQESAQQDSFASGLLDWPHYTRPEVVAGRAVPEVLLSGNHEAIRRWRLQQALGRTWQRRPELLAERTLTAEERQLLEDYKAARRVPGGGT
jgi:tRNA (guanine37-N1)-methyltransferase